MDKNCDFSWPLNALPQIRRCGLFSMEPDSFRTTYYSKHHHALHLYLYEGAIMLGEKRFSLKPGEITITPAGVASSYRLNVPGKHWCVHFSVAERGEDCVNIPLHVRMSEGQTYFRERLQRVSRLFNRPTRSGIARTISTRASAAAFMELLLQLTEFSSPPALHKPNHKSERALGKVREIIEENLAGALDVPELAERVGLSQNYLARTFRSKTGMTLKGYLLLRRMEETKYLLQSTDLPIKAVAARVGYRDTQYFNKLFRRSAGVSPTAFRHRENQ